MSYRTYLAAAGQTPPRRAPYAFVPVNQTVLPSPLEMDQISHVRPLNDGIGGTLSLRITTETPLLVGAQSDQNNSPLDMGGQWALPGASIRGMIRAVTEIAAFGRLNFVDDYHGARRDFDDVKPIINPVQQNTPYAKTGWLFARSTGRGGSKALDFVLVPAAQTKWKEPEEFTPMLGTDTTAWHNMDVAERYAILKPQGAFGLVDGEIWGYESGERWQLFVTAHRAGKPGKTYKKWELLSLWPSGAVPMKRIDRATGHAFHQSLLDAKTLAEPKVEAVLAQASGFGSGLPFDEQVKNPMDHAIHVVWRNPGGADQATPVDAPVLSLSAYWKVPYKNGLLDVAKLTQPDMAKTADHQPLDLVEAMFGWASEDTDDHQPLKTRPPRERAVRSRVKFGFAKADKIRDGTYKQTLPGIAPRPSFFPFYLTGPEGASHPMHFDNPDARLAGRKRYPARNRVPVPPPEVGDRQSSVCTFLNKGHRFTSQIRVHNLHPVELGALVWALTLGQLTADAGFRHMLGRGKAYGFGQVKVEITDTALARVMDGGAVDLAAAVAAFKSWALRGLGCEGGVFEELEPIHRLLNTCHAATGDALLAADALAFPSLKKDLRDSEQIVKAYKQLRDAAMTKVGAPKAFPLVSKTPGDIGFVSLAPYPRLEE